jgi:hypothetical protein
MGVEQVVLQRAQVTSQILAGRGDGGPDLSRGLVVPRRGGEAAGRGYSGPPGPAI